MAKLLANPLPDSRLKEINQALGLIIQTREALNKAGRCGYDPSDEMAQLSAIEEQLNAFKREYFPLSH